MARGKLLSSSKAVPAYLDDAWRTKISAAKLMDRLRLHAYGEVEMTPTQIKAAEILLRKVVPDLAAIQHSGEITHNTRAVDLPDDQLAVIATGRGGRTPAAPGGPQEPASVH
jgi:hypothetical protein